MEGGIFLKEKLEEEEGFQEFIDEKMEPEAQVKKPAKICSFVRNWGGWLIGDE